ncbi:hypothetical protein F7725_017656 [Dissostichus mawsoni]|uniref:Uncharacterized protein n=1 Tax=Dissostichus mawsoni TaxID=36200 RepID=A0A7J5Z5X1_DISMA|nr:hypothetical protein F7725_017656 [Dissostichus mawsoni]
MLVDQQDQHGLVYQQGLIMSAGRIDLQPIRDETSAARTQARIDHVLRQTERMRKGTETTETTQLARRRLRARHAARPVYNTPSSRRRGSNTLRGEASLDSSSPDFVPSVFMYTKQSQNPNAKMDRYHRKRRRADTAANQRVTSETPEQECSMDPEQECSMDHCPAEEDIPVPKREYDDLNLRYSQLQEEYVNLRQEFDTLRAENVKLKEELQKSTFSYTTVKCNIGQLNFLTGLTSVVFEWLITKMMGSVERIHNKLTVEDHLLIILMNEGWAYVSKTTISNILRSWVPAMALVLKPLIKWPNYRELLDNNF